MQNIKVSVITPVYNAEAFIEKAVISALEQPQTGEVILVEDASPDNCLAICKRLEQEHNRVKLLTHPNNKNRGAGASRNLGMQHASFPYIAFLDADDYYLPGRFNKTEEIFRNTPDIDGVYEACGFEFYTEEAKEYEAKDAGIASGELDNHLYTINQTIESKDFFYRWVKGNIGFFITNGITFKKKLLNTTGLMDTELRLHQDTEFYYRLAAMGELAPGEINKAVAIIGRHEDNRITQKTQKDIKFQVMVWEKLLHFVLQNKNRVDKRAFKYIIKNRIIFYDGSYTFKNKYIRVLKRYLNALILCTKQPALLRYL